MNDVSDLQGAGCNKTKQRRSASRHCDHQPVKDLWTERRPPEFIPRFGAELDRRRGELVIRSVRNLVAESSVCRVLGLDLDHTDAASSFEATYAGPVPQSHQCLEPSMVSPISRGAASSSRAGKPVAQYLIIGIQSYRSFKVPNSVIIASVA
jgi:hypothetical protein